MQKNDPDVNSTEFDEDFGSHENIQEKRDGNASDIEHGHRNDEVVPVPPDKQLVVPIEDPPGSNEPPVGDIDTGPEKIAGD
jgi:hypothetical protein